MTNDYILIFQDPDKSNNGIKYKLQLLYTNGKTFKTKKSFFFFLFQWLTHCNATAFLFLVDVLTCKNMLVMLPLIFRFFAVYKSYCIHPCNHQHFLHVFSLFFLLTGIRQEQDIYVRLIDSATKQVSG